MIVYFMTRNSIEPITYEAVPDYYIEDGNFKALIDKENREKVLTEVGKDSLIVARVGKEEKSENGESVYVDFNHPSFPIEELI